MPRKVILKCHLSPGDIMTLTAAIKSLHDRYPGEYQTDVRTSCDAIFENNPQVTRLDDDDVRVIDMQYSDLIHRCNQVPNAFLRGYTDHLGKQLGIALDLTVNRPQIWLSAEEKQWINQVNQYFTHRDTKFWVVNAGVKPDFTLKQWPVEYYQEVIDHFRGPIQFVQVGEQSHEHPILNNVINLVGQTDVRQLLRLCWWAEGGLGPITFLQHIFAAYEKPYVAILGGREPASWVQYPVQTTLHTLGALDCCRHTACWRSRVVQRGDGAEQDGSVCDKPVLGMQRPVGKCMAIIKPIEVIRAISRYYEGGALAY